MGYAIDQIALPVFEQLIFFFQYVENTLMMKSHVLAPSPILARRYAVEYGVSYDITIYQLDP